MATRKKTSTAAERPSIGLPDPLEAARETARHMAEGNRKLAVSVDALRQALENIARAEWDHQTNSPVGPTELRALAVAGLDAYSKLIGQDWRRNPLVGSRAGDRNIATLAHVPE